MDTTENDGTDIDPDVLPPFTLRKPVIVGDKSYARLTFRAATGGDYRKSGALFQVSGSGEFRPEANACLTMAGRLATPAIVPAVIDKMDARDSQALVMHVIAFFGQED